MEYPHLFSPIQLNKLTLRNRIVAAPIGELYEPKAPRRCGSGRLRSYDCGTWPQFVCQRRGTDGVFQI